MWSSSDLSETILTTAIEQHAPLVSFIMLNIVFESSKQSAFK